MKDKEKQNNNEIKTEDDIQKDPENMDLENQKLDIDPEVLDKIVSELEEKYNLKKENIKIVKVKAEPEKRTFLKVLLKDVLFWMFDFLLIISLNGYLQFSEFNIVKLLLFSIVFYIIELAARVAIHKYYQKIIVYSFGTVMIPVTIIALMLAQLATGLTFESDNMILFFIFFMIVRIILRFVVLRKEIKVIMKGRKK